MIGLWLVMEFCTLVILYLWGSETNVEMVLLTLVLDSGAAVLMYAGVIIFYEFYVRQPLPPDLFYLGIWDPFSLQEGWLLWGIIGIIGNRAATTATMRTTNYLSLKLRRRGAMHKVKVFFLKKNKRKRQVDKVVGSTKASVCLVVASFLLCPLVEEYMYRGFLMASLTKWLPTPIAVVVSSVAFAVTHRSLERLPHLFVSGLVLGLIYAQTRSLMAPIVSHGLWNLAVACEMLVRSKTFNWKWPCRSCRM